LADARFCRYNSRVTCECCEAVLRVLLGSSPPATSPTLLAPSVEPTLRSVLAHNAPHWSGLRYSEKAVQDFFAEAARVGSAPRVSKRQRTAPAFADEERANPRAAEQQKLAEKRAVREAARGAAEEERAESAAALARAEREVKAARRRCREAEEGLQAAEGRLAAAREAHALLERGAGGKEEEEEDDANGTTNPRGTVLWSSSVRCVPGRRCFAQFGDLDGRRCIARDGISHPSVVSSPGVDDDELWFRATVLQVYRDDVGQWADVKYDDGDEERMKPIKRIKALEDSSSDEEEEEEEEEEGGQEEEEEGEEPMQESSAEM